MPAVPVLTYACMQLLRMLALQLQLQLQMPFLLELYFTFARLSHDRNHFSRMHAHAAGDVIITYAQEMGVDPTDVAFTGGIGRYETAAEIREARVAHQRQLGAYLLHISRWHSAQPAGAGVRTCCACSARRRRKPSPAGRGAQLLCRSPYPAVPARAHPYPRVHALHALHALAQGSGRATAVGCGGTPRRGPPAARARRSIPRARPRGCPASTFGAPVLGRRTWASRGSATRHASRPTRSRRARPSLWRRRRCTWRNTPTLSRWGQRRVPAGESAVARAWSAGALQRC